MFELTMRSRDRLSPLDPPTGISHTQPPSGQPCRNLENGLQPDRSTSFFLYSHHGHDRSQWQKPLASSAASSPSVTPASRSPRSSTSLGNRSSRLRTRSMISFENCPISRLTSNVWLTP